MKLSTSLLLALCGLLPALASAQTPAEPAALPIGPILEPGYEVFAARPGEEKLAERLNGIRVVATPAQLADPGFPHAGFDATRVPKLNTATFPYAVSGFLDGPVSRQSLDRLLLAIRFHARSLGLKFLSIYLPPQDITDGYVQVVASEATTEGEVAVRGAKYFSERSYRAALRQQPGQPIDEAGLQDSVAWLNRNPYRRVTVAAESGSQPGTTRLALRTSERRPWQVYAGYDNTGSESTDEDRVFAGFGWGNAFGRGDQLSYRFTADPDFKYSESHSGSYTAYLPWRHTLTAIGAWSRIESEMPLPFSQVGHSWQTGLRYDIDLRAPRAGWTHNLTWAADFKYSDNNLEFADLPVTDNATHVVQFGAIYALNLAGEGSQSRLTATVMASPGGLTSRNHGRYFDVSRAGAKASYVYGRLDGQYSRSLPVGLTWISAASLQYTDVALLGSEQLSGGGASAVRGYRESTVFGDWGIVANNELHTRAIGLPHGIQLDPFAFVDFGSLQLNVDNESTDIASVGAGLNLQCGSHFSVRGAYGWQLNQLDRRPDEHGAGHVSATLSW